MCIQTWIQAPSAFNVSARNESRGHLDGHSNIAEKGHFLLPPPNFGSRGLSQTCLLAICKSQLHTAQMFVQNYFLRRLYTLSLSILEALVKLMVNSITVACWICPLIAERRALTMMTQMAQPTVASVPEKTQLEI